MPVLISQATFCITDTETTGLDPSTDRVCEVAGVRWSLSKGELSRFESLVDPERAIPPEASAIHHLVDEDVAGQPVLKDVLCTLNAEHFDVWVAHNAEFDFGFLPRDGRPVLCTFRLARKVLPDFPKHTNQFLRYALKLQVPGAQGLPAHRALADVFVTTALLHHLLLEAGKLRPEIRTVEDLIAWTQEPNLQKVCNFGNKHRGTLWKDVPREYLVWMLDEVKKMDPDVRFTAEYWLNQPSH